MFRPKCKTKFDIRQKIEESPIRPLSELLKKNFNDRTEILLKRLTTSIPKRKLINESLKKEDTLKLEFKYSKVKCQLA